MLKKQIPFYVIIVLVVGSLAYGTIPALTTIADDPLSLFMLLVVGLLVGAGIYRVLRA